MGITERKKEMKKKYPDMDESRFEYTIEKNKVSVWFIKDDGYRINISDPEFINTKAEWIYLHNNKEKNIEWPKIFSGNGKVYPIVSKEYFSNWRVKKYYFPKRNLPYKINKFKIYVNEADSFPSDLPSISTSWYKLSDSHPDIRKEFDYTNPYFSAICGVYVSTFLSGISKVHLTQSNNIPKITVSLLRFHVYFWVRRFIRYPKLLRKYSSDFSAVKKCIPIKAKDYDSGDGKYIFTGFTNIDSDDFVRFIPDVSNGFTKVGLELLNQSIEAFIYCILGAQARTRQPIVGARASALETQDVFRKFVEDSVVNYSISTWVNNMNKSIVDTNVVLNLAVSKSLWLLPSNMIILKKPIIGYNNLLKVATKEMNFGINKSVNKMIPKLPNLRPIKKDDFSPVSPVDDTHKKSIIGENLPLNRTISKKSPHR